MSNKLIGAVTPVAQIQGNVSSNAQINVTVESIGSVSKPYIHPEYHPASMIIEDEERRFVTLQEKNEIHELKNKVSYVHDQISSSKEWIINHGLDRHPAITVVDSAGSVVVGEIIYISLNEVVLEFTSEFSGKAYFN